MNGHLITVLCCLTVGTCLAADSINLARLDADLAAFKMREANTKLSDQDRLKAKYERLKLELLVARDADYPARHRELMDFLSSSDGWKAESYVSFLFASVGYDATRQRQFETPDLLSLAEKASRGDAKARLAYFTGAIRHYERMLAFEPTSLDPRYSREARLAFIDKSLEDPLLVKARGTVLSAKADVLRALDRKADAEQLMREAVEESEAMAFRFLPKLAAAYEDDAARFYGKPDRTVLKKAQAALDRYFAVPDVEKRDRGGFAKACEQRARLELACEDAAAAVKWTERLSALSKNGETNMTAAVLFGDAAYLAGDWKRAADAYRLAAAKLPWRTREKFARALYASGQFGEALKETELTAAKAGKYKRQELRHMAEVLRHRERISR